MRARTLQVEAAESTGVIVSLSKHPVDTSSSIWRISPTERIDWDSFSSAPEFYVRACREFARHLIRTAAARSVGSEFGRLEAAVVQCPIREDQHCLDTGSLGEEFFTDLEKVCKARGYSKRYTNDIVLSQRRFYIWAADAGFDGFDPDVATALEDKVFGTFAANEAVLRNDPKHGPLREHEFLALSNALRAQTLPGQRSIPVRDVVVGLLAMSFGLYGRHLQLLNEEDYYTESLSDGSVSHFLRVPRLKKRVEVPREQWKVRALDPRIGAVIQELIAANAKAIAADPRWNDDEFHRPLFRGVYTDLVADGAFRQETYRLTQVVFNRILGSIVTAFGLKGSDKKPLCLTFRRLRYSYATRLVSLGAAPIEVAEALDHSSTHHVMVYFNGREMLARRMEKKMALELAAISQLFLGQVIRREDAPKGDDVKPPITWPHHTEKTLSQIGSCGTFDHCALAMPKACYPCRLFRPWLDAPHERVLDSLLEERAMKEEAGMAPTIIKLLDDVIIACAQTVRACEAMRAAETSRGAE
ncbi:hypothetical protein HL658_12540 [Azospirillum sp. RWY-5-1]|uniref:Tyr recombinase domain-containing protein n=1 Tax=Azospirillum oleiclasticum TaxID=2735135 RepID=A0ABX2TBC6_9PROT|nr:hypothetical protein [Azospirillum oleiclasticum]NYZ13381.1 hypothetical protein [Azospirillum oleiclasticum]NYZ20542.1 hypothetical protein [Azospirillum oleiclasticum]